MHPIQVFISYTHDSEQHRDNVLALAQRLRRDGIDARLDRFETSPPEGWPRWMQRQIEEAAFVLAICTSTYKARVEGREVGAYRGLGADWEGAILTRDLYLNHSRNQKVIPVLFHGWSMEHLPDQLKVSTYYKYPDDYLKLIRHVTGQPEAVPVPIGAIPKLPYLEEDLIRSEGATQEVWQEPERLVPLSEARVVSTQVAQSVHHREEPVILNEQLADAIKRRETLAKFGLNAESLGQEILQLRREIRDSSRLKAGDFIGSGRYVLARSVGWGGFGFVWEAFDSLASGNAERQVAIKILRGELAQDPISRDRFFRGARRMQQLQHQNIVKVIEPYGEENGFCYFVMEFVPGGDFRKAVLEKKPSPQEALATVIAIAGALGAAHELGLTHRDVKPENILVAAPGRPLLTDFDLVGDKQTTGGTRTGALGSIMYAAPELLSRPQDATAACDVYGLGMTAVFALLGSDLPSDVIQIHRGLM